MARILRYNFLFVGFVFILSYTVKKYIFIFILVFLSACSSINESSIASANPDIRRKAVDKMGSSKEASRYFNLFMELLQNDPDSFVRVQCAYYLGQFHHKEALPFLIKATDDNNVFLRQEAVGALGEIKDNSTLPTLLKLLENDSNIEVRRRCAVALGKIGDTKAVDGLIQQLDDINPSVVYASHQALREITKQDFGENIKLWEQWKETQK